MEHLWMSKPYAQCRRIKEHVSESALRIQRESPTHVLLQLRVKSKAGFESGTIAHASLSKSEVREVIDYLTEVEKELLDAQSREAA